VKSGRYKSNVEKLNEFLADEPVVSRFRVQIHAIGKNVGSTGKRRRH